MKKIYTSVVVGIFVLLFATGCNSDVFLDGPELPEETFATIEGDGGVAEFEIPLKGLEHISLDLMSDELKYCSYYDNDGNVIDRKSPASQVSKIVFETYFRKLEILKQGGKLVVKSICETDKYETHWTIRLEYDYGVKFIMIKVEPGMPLELIEVCYTSELKVTDNAEIKTSVEGYRNNGTLPQVLEIRPYIHAMATILVEPEKYSLFKQGETITMKVPVYDNGSWVLKDKSGINPGNRLTYYRPDQMMKVDVDIPANSYVNVFTDIVYTKAQAFGRMTFLNRALDKRLEVVFRATSLYPEYYKIRIEDAK